jgi:hypothetical protein
MTVQWVLLIPGVILIAAGLIIFKYRTWVTRFIVDSQRAMFGKIANPLVRRAKSSQIAVPAIGFVCFGVVLITLSIFLPPYHRG